MTSASYCSNKSENQNETISSEYIIEYLLHSNTIEYPHNKNSYMITLRCITTEVPIYKDKIYVALQMR